MWFIIGQLQRLQMHHNLEILFNTSQPHFYYFVNWKKFDRLKALSSKNIVRSVVLKDTKIRK